MNSLVVISWITMGVFVAWIGRHLIRDRELASSSGIGNLAVGVLGALLGGALAHSMLGGVEQYHAFLISSGGALLLAAVFLAATHFTPHGHARSHV